MPAAYAPEKEPSATVGAVPAKNAATSEPFNVFAAVNVFPETVTVCPTYMSVNVTLDAATPSVTELLMAVAAAVPPGVAVNALVAAPVEVAVNVTIVLPGVLLAV